MSVSKIFELPDLFTNILSYLDKQTLKSIVPAFKKRLHYEYIMPTIHTLLYGQVQAGKTNKIIEHIEHYKTNILKILIMQNSVNMQEQYVKIFKNKKIMYKIIDTNALSYSYNNEQVLITIYNKYRMNILNKYLILNNITNYCLILDESDQYLDNIKKHNIFQSGKHILHVTATPFKYTKQFKPDNIIQLQPTQNYLGINEVDIHNVLLIIDYNQDINRVKINKIISLLQEDFFKQAGGFMLINCFTRIIQMLNVANELSNMYHNIPFIVLSSSTHVVINGMVVKQLKIKNIQKFIDSFNIYPHIVFIANRLSNRGINYTTTNYSRNISHQISMPTGDYTNFLQKCRLFGIREQFTIKPKLYCLISNCSQINFINRLKYKINNLFVPPIQPIIKNKITIPQLKALCRKNNIKGFSKLRKQEIIELLQQNNIVINV